MKQRDIDLCREYANLIAETAESKHPNMTRMRELKAELGVPDFAMDASNLKVAIAKSKMPRKTAVKFFADQLAQCLIRGKAFIPGIISLDVSGDVSITPMPSPRKVR